VLERHGSLGYEQLAALVDAPPDSVRSVLAQLRDRGLISVLPVGRLVDHRTDAVAYWQLTAAGRTELARLRASGDQVAPRGQRL
jgi:hypothetical protein